MPNLLKSLSLATALALSAAPVVKAEGFAGAFLAAKSANIANDYAEAAYYFSRAMVSEPENGFIMQGALFAFVATGDVSSAEAIARKMAQAGFTDEYAHNVMLAAAMQREDYDAVLGLLADPAFDINPLITQLLTGWALIGSGEVEAGIEALAASGSNDAINAFGLYNKGIALAFRQDFEAANAVFEAGGAYVNRGSLIAHTQILAELGRTTEALDFMVKGPGASLSDRGSDALRVQLLEGAPVRFDLVTSVQDGAAEVFLVLGDALHNDESDRLAVLFSRLAEHLNPTDAEAKLLIGDILSNQGQYELALVAYNAVPNNDPLALNAKLGKALNQRQNGQLDAAIETLQTALELAPESLSLWQSLGDVLRQNGEPERASEAYSSAIDLLPAPDIRAAWRLYYSRGIVEFRSDNWPSAEVDFRHALALSPDQPDVLNYLGYSLVERGEKLDEALAMIETAVAAKPESGAIADSLGWVYYQLGRYEDAEKAMEIAVQLLPVDPILSDHYGDVLWMVDRKREARFQWRRALSYGPEEEDAVRIRAKLEQGLDAVLAAE